MSLGDGAGALFFCLNIGRIIPGLVLCNYVGEVPLDSRKM